VVCHHSHRVSVQDKIIHSGGRSRAASAGSAGKQLHNNQFSGYSKQQN